MWPLFMIRQGQEVRERRDDSVFKIKGLKYSQFHRSFNIVYEKISSGETKNGSKGK